MTGFRLWQIAGWTMLHYFWIGALLGAAAMVLRRLLQPTSPTVRYTAALGCFFLLCASPIGIAAWATLHVPSQTLPNVALDVAPPSREIPAVAHENVQSAIAVDASAMHGGGLPPVAEANVHSEPLPQPVAPQEETTWLAAFDPIAARLPWLWLIGSPLTFLLTTAGLLGAERLRRSSRPPADDRTAELCRRLAAAMRISRCVGVAVCDRIAAPILLGVVRPMILLPAAAAGWTPEQLEMVLLHELAHVRRFDNLVNLAQRFLESVLFFHPMVWLVSAWVRREREHCCDALVVSRTGRPHDYAALLVTLAETFSTSLSRSRVVSSMAERPLVVRVRQILNKEGSSMRVSSKTFALAFLAFLALSVVFVGRFAMSSQAEDVIQLPAASESSPKSSSDAPTEPKVVVPGDAIEGVVVDEHGKPASGVTIRACQHGLVNSTTTSKADGTFRVELPEPLLSETTLTASNADGMRQGLMVLETPRRQVSKTVRLVLKPSHAVTAVVVDAKGQPVADAAVEISCWGGRMAQATTDPQGKALLRIPVETRGAYVIARKAGVGVDYFQRERSGELPTGQNTLPESVRLVLDGAAPVEVKTVDSAGKPVAGVKVELWTLSKKGKKGRNALTLLGVRPSATSDEQGRAVFDFLPVDPDGLEFCVRSDDYAIPITPRFRIQDGGDPRHLTAQLLRKSELRGRVTHADGRPAAGILIQVEGMGKPSYIREYTKTSSDGVYRLKVDPNNSCIIAVIDDQWAAKSLIGVIVKEGDRHDNLDFRLERGTLISGTVTIGPDKQPFDGTNLTFAPPTLLQLGAKLPDEWKWRFQPRSKLVRWGGLDATGHYSMRVGPGEYDFQLPGGEWNKPKRIVVTDQKEIVIDAHIPMALPKSLHGRVVDTLGNPVADAFVAFPSNLHLTTDKEGRFVTGFGNGGGPCRIHARSAERNLAGSKTITEDDAEVTIVLDTAATATGRVLDAEGHPAAGVRVQYNFFLRPPEEHCWLPVTAETDKAGRYTMTGLPVGFVGDEVTVSWLNPVTKKYESYPGQKFKVKPGENRLDDVILKPAAAAVKTTKNAVEAKPANRATAASKTGGLQFHVVDEAGKPIPRALLRLTRGTGDSECTLAAESLAFYAPVRIVEAAGAKIDGEKMTLTAEKLRIFGQNSDSKHGNDAVETERGGNIARAEKDASSSDKNKLMRLVVVDKAGKPIPGAKIKVDSNNYRYQEVMTADSLVLEGDGLIQATGTGWLRQPGNDGASATNTGSMRVVVLDTQGKPLPDVKVFACVCTREKNSKIIKQHYKTDMAGIAVVELPKNCTSLRLWANKTNYVPMFADWEEGFIFAHGAVPKTFTFTLAKGTTIGGVVKNEEGQPIAGAKVEVSMSRPRTFDRANPLEPENQPIESGWLALGDGACVTDAQGRWTLGNGVYVALCSNR